MSPSSEKAWNYFGASEPYYGVIVNDDYRSAKINASAKAEFYRSGEVELAEHLRLVASVVDLKARKVAIDFGCGVGRLTFPLSKSYKHVFGIDISPGMIDVLTRNALDLGISNVTCAQAVDEVPVAADLIVSRIVLQHIPVAEGLNQINKMWNKLSSGGVLAVEVPVASRFGLTKKLVRWLRDRVPYSNSLVNLVKGRPLVEPGMQMNVYPLNQVVSRLYEAGADRVHLIKTTPDIMHTCSIIIAVKDQ
jgi:trans-aconitate methyltransferase